MPRTLLLISLVFISIQWFSQVPVDTIRIYKTESELYDQWTGSNQIKQNGDKVEYYIDNKMVTELEYRVITAKRDSVENYYQGKYIIFHKNGIPTFSCIWYFEGYYDGTYKQYDKKGRLRYVTTYDKGTIVGCGYIYDKQGNCKKATGRLSGAKDCACPTEKITLHNKN